MKTTYRKLYKFETQALAEDWLIKKNPQDVYDFYIIDEDKFYYNVIEDKKLIPQSGVGAVTVSENGVAKGNTENIDFIDGDNTTFDVVKDLITGKIKVKVNASGGSPAGSDTQIQYNNAGAFGASSDLTFDPATSTFKAVTDNPLFRSTIKFSSNGGTDDLTASLATAFTGTPPTTFIVLAYGNIQIVDYINLVGGNFSQGDTITGSVSGAEGYVAYDDGVGQFYVSITNSIQFAATDVIDNANGVTADYDTSTTSDDIFFWYSTNGGSGGPIVITGTAQTLNDGIDITFGSTTGHGAEDSWLWSYKTLKNTWLTNNQAEGAVRGYVNGSVYDNGSNNIVAINGLVQNGDDDRIFPLSFYQDLSSGNRNERERAYYGLDIFKGDPANPLEFVVKTQKGIGAVKSPAGPGPGPVPGTTEISTLTVGALSGFEFISDKSFQVSTPLFVTQGSLFSWTGDTNGNGITIDDSTNEITLATSHTTQPAVTFTGSGLDDLEVSLDSFSGTYPTTYTITVAGTGTPDTFDWTDGTNSGTGVSMSTSLITLSNGMEISFGATTGHTLTESWTWTYSYVNQNVLDFSNNDYKFQSVLDTDTFGYQIGDNILGNRIKGSLNTWVNGSDSGIIGILREGDDVKITNSINFSTGEICEFYIGRLGAYLIVGDGLGGTTELNNTGTTFYTWSNTVVGYNGIENSSGVTSIGNISGGNNTKITIDDVNEHITISNVPAYDDDTAAGVGGLTAGMVYMTTGSGSAPLNAAGILMIKQ